MPASDRKSSRVCVRACPAQAPRGVAAAAPDRSIYAQRGVKHVKSPPPATRGPSRAPSRPFLLRAVLAPVMASVSACQPRRRLSNRTGRVRVCGVPSPRMRVPLSRARRSQVRFVRAYAGAGARPRLCPSSSSWWRSASAGAAILFFLNGRKSRPVRDMLIGAPRGKFPGDSGLCCASRDALLGLGIRTGRILH